MTELDPVTLPTAESAYSEDLAAVILANVSGSEVPRATRVIAVTESGIPHTHPSIEAQSPTIAVTPPIKVSATMNAGHPPPHWVGGTHANATFHVMFRKWVRASPNEGSSRIVLPSS